MFDRSDSRETHDPNTHGGRETAAFASFDQRKVGLGYMGKPFPFSAIVGQEDMKLAFLVAAVDATVGGVLAFGDRGTGKSTAVRALAALLPTCALSSAAPIIATRRAGGPVLGLRRRAAGRPQDRIAAGSRGRSAARRDRGPCRRRARSRTRSDARRESVRAGSAGAGPSRLSLYRRSQSARGPSGRSAARCRRLAARISSSARA